MVLWIFRDINRLLQLMSSLDHRAGVMPSTIPRFITDVTIIIVISSWYVYVGGSTR